MTINFKNNLIKAAVAVIGTFIAANSYAATNTSNMSVSATVAANCSISAGALSFGTYDTVSAAAVDGTATISTTCTSGSAATVTLGQGLNAATTSTDAAPLRQMKAGTDVMAYQLYSESGRTTVWGNTTATGKATTGTGSNVDVTVYGRITAGQNTLPAGSYTDTVVATITF